MYYTIPLDLALRLGEEGIATSLVEHDVNVNQMTALGESLLHTAIQRFILYTRSSGPYGPFLLAPAEGIGGPFGPPPPHKIA